MGLSEVVGEVRRDGEGRAQAVIDAARREAEAILADARQKARTYEDERLKEAGREAAQITAQSHSRADSEARKAVLTTEAALRGELRRAALKALANLPAKSRQAHVKTLVGRAQAIVPKGKVFGAETDAAFLKDAKAYSFGGSIPVTGGLVVESDDGKVRLDLTYETLLDEMWRDVLRAEAALFR